MEPWRTGIVDAGEDHLRVAGYDVTALMTQRTFTDVIFGPHPGRRTNRGADLLARARAAMRAVDGYDQAAVDRLCQAVAWAGGNEQTATRLANMSVDESGMGSREPRRRAKVLGHPPRRAAPEEHGHHRGDSGEGHRQVREAGRRHRRR